MPLSALQGSGHLWTMVWGVDLSLMNPCSRGQCLHRVYTGTCLFPGSPVLIDMATHGVLHTVDVFTALEGHIRPLRALYGLALGASMFSHKRTHMMTTAGRSEQKHKIDHKGWDPRLLDLARGPLQSP